MLHNRKAFLMRLRLYLAPLLPPDEVRDVISEYDSFFSAGIAEGKTEKELCREFGTPSQIARNMLSEAGVKFIARSAFVLMWGTAVLHLTRWQSWDEWSIHPWFHYILLLLAVPALCLFWKARYIPAPRLSQSGWKRVVIMFAIPLLMWALDFSYNAWCFASVFIEGVPAPFPVTYPSSAGTIVTLCYYAALVPTVITLAASLLSACTESPWFFPAVTHCVGVMASLGRFMAHFKSMNIDRETSITGVCLPPLCLYLTLWLAGTFITLLIVQKGVRCGRAA